MRYRTPIGLLFVFLAAVLLGSGCDDEGDGGSDVRRSESLLVVKNSESPVDVLQTSEQEVVSFGVEDDGSILLEASESGGEVNERANVSSEGDEALLASSEVEVRYQDDNGDGTGTLTVLDAEEEEVASNDEFVLSGSEEAASKQSDPFATDEEIATARAALESGVFRSLADGAIAAAGSGSSYASSIEQTLTNLLATLGSLSDLLAQADTSNELPEGVTARPTLLQVPQSNGTFATEYTVDSLFTESGAAAFRSFVTVVSEELNAFINGALSNREVLPQYLEDVDGYEVDLNAENAPIRYRLNWSASVDLDLHVDPPNGEEIYYQNTMSAGGELDIDDISGGPGSEENVIFEQAAEGAYEGFVRYFSGSEPVNYELTAYRNGLIVDRIRDSFAADESGEDGPSITIVE